MDASQSQSQSTQCSSSSKHPEMQDTEDESTTEELPTKITDLNEDCLVKIFGYLDIKHLLNVAIANIWLRPAAAEVYKTKFGKKVVHLRDFTCNHFQRTRGNAHTIFVYGLKTCLLYLRCFGSSINNLCMDFVLLNGKYKPYEHVHHYINTYCVKSLNEIKFLRMPKISVDQFVKPFEKVRCVTVDRSDLGELLPQFATWFPNLRHLKLDAVHLTDGFDRAHFPYLEELILNGCDANKYTFRNAANLLDTNRQLQSLEIDLPELSMNTLLNMIEDHSFITKLVVSESVWRKPVNSFQIQRIAKEHLSLIELDLKGILLFTPKDVIALIDKLKSLQTFDFRIENSSDVSRLHRYLTKIYPNEWTLTKFDWDSSYLRLNRKQ